MKKLTFLSKLMTSQTRHQVIIIHILPDISRSKDDQTMKFDQLIELSASLDQQSKML